MKILIADDDRMLRMILRRYLENWGHAVDEVVDGKRAIEALGGDAEYDLLITDWLMPEMDGLELCRQARELKRERYLPIILLTARSDKADLVKGLDAGADSFVPKPLNAAELQAQIRVAERVIQLEGRLLAQYDQLSEAHERLERDMRAAANVQESLLPQESPACDFADFAWIFKACEHVAGDVYNVFPLDDDHIGMYVLDVSGHGVQAALLSVNLCRVLTPWPEQGGVLKIATPGEPDRINPPAEVARVLNRRFPVLDQSGQFFTFCYGIHHRHTREFRYVCAGHPGPILMNRDSTQDHNDVKGIPIGISDDFDYEEATLRCEPGDCVVLFTDGVHETENPNRDMFEISGILQSLDRARLARQPIQAAIQTLQDDVTAFAQGETQDDDVTILGMQAR